MKTFAITLTWFITTVFTLYLPLSFSALSFNPVHWSHTERFIFAIVIWFGCLVSYFKKYIPKAVYKP